MPVVNKKEKRKEACAQIFRRLSCHCDVSGLTLHLVLARYLLISDMRQIL